MKKEKVIIKYCIYCGKEFKTYSWVIKTGRGKYCSKICFRLIGHSTDTRKKISETKKRNGDGKGNKNPMYIDGGTVKECPVCHVEFKVPTSTKNYRKFCSIACKARWQSINLKGKNNPLYGRAKEDSPMYGKHHSIETREKIRIAQSGPRSHLWQGGISFEPYGIEFNKILKEEIRKRDNYVCQECGYTQKQLGYNLNVHHIDYNKQNNQKNNLICLCNSCHQKANFHRNDWIVYFSNKINKIYEYCI